MYRCTVYVTIFSTGGKLIPTSFEFYVVTHSFSSHPFLCTLGIVQDKSEQAAHCSHDISCTHPIHSNRVCHCGREHDDGNFGSQTSYPSPETYADNAVICPVREVTMATQVWTKSHTKIELNLLFTVSLF